jgi:hypothetical protein
MSVSSWRRPWAIGFSLVGAWRPAGRVHGQRHMQKTYSGLAVCREVRAGMRGHPRCTTGDPASEPVRSGRTSGGSFGGRWSWIVPRIVRTSQPKPAMLLKQIPSKPPGHAAEPARRRSWRYPEVDVGCDLHSQEYRPRTHPTSTVLHDLSTRLRGPQALVWYFAATSVLAAGIRGIVNPWRRLRQVGRP